MPLLDDLNTAREEARRLLESTASPRALEELRVRYLGRSGRLRGLMARLKEVPADEKAAAGQLANAVKEDLSAFFDRAARRLAASVTAAGSPLPDPTLPGCGPKRGTSHPLAQTTERILGIFERMGFNVAEGPEIEDDFHNFTALNIPEHHPARDSFDTFFVEGGGILRSQTSTVQIHVMQAQPPPVRIVAPGR
ncbi:MAG: phenylalanine--tRNA ligase subunit alpha, partial [Planctomycetota bacterium]